MAGNANSGRRPKSHDLKVLAGITRADRLNPEEPKALAGMPEKPADLSPLASEIWDRLSKLCLELGTLTTADGEAFVTLCELRATAAIIAKEKGREDFRPLVIEATVDGDGGTHVKHRENQILRMERQTAASVRPYLDMFGLTPAGRPKLKLATASTPSSRLAAFNRSRSA